MSNQLAVRTERISSVIRSIRGQKVILDSDLAAIYGVPTKALNQAVKRNLKRFPADFVFQLTPSESEGLRSQFVTSSSHGGRRGSPYAFTEQGAIMAASVLNSQQAVRLSVFVVRAFVQMRELLGGTKELARQLADLEKKLTARLDGHDTAIIEILQRLLDVLEPVPELPEPEKPKRQIGFHVDREEKPATKTQGKK